MSEPKPIDFSVLDLKPGHKYVIFVDPCAIDMDALINVKLDADAVFIPVSVPAGKTVTDCVKLSPRGGPAEEWIQQFNEEHPNAVSD